MPFRSASSPIRLRRVLVVAALLLVVCAAVAARGAGRWLVREDPLERADAIFVLGGGTGWDRLVEGGDLFLQGWAPRIVLSSEVEDGGQRELARRGLPVPIHSERQKVTLVQMGVPASAIAVLPPILNSTEDEGETLARLAREGGWRRVIVVTSKLHTRRARSIMRRHLAGRDVTVIMRASRVDVADPDHWWRDHSDIRWVLFEMEKLAAYYIGVG